MEKNIKQSALALTNLIRNLNSKVASSMFSTVIQAGLIGFKVNNKKMAAAQNNSAMDKEQ